ncbi:symmetrical bis(5'-nucleosyl)-tetraphosphatase [Pseudoalteromonas tunicata]|uniref:bis(5'-nucleosyl)-tetraphosphatase (symmetrical) n=1 Tax=Pseudoalteromonas tunicata D2 TaxID=87626 RepID=A4C994_9GAMM|nr:symmetrical bis(5'-nucleosyl)-tetraphosphatase [Pseudoalteromonas tunicata]ATC93663.1 bis(5'-nucleosyl)-tetraphosphatase (symmetrical) [Pseudoalteromonas tunicata]AXT29493.1 symmetrical bis(5'-nucleosyl)-tetraphosphatase [Pseudoalteromonas tunicata]EAR29159.1 diadenosine tetraphosphatase (Ap4A hydrolase) [Pseudoalteromonas tunicata D2]
MAQYVIGDLQGCFKEFKAILATLAFNPSQDTLYLVGDIVARGPDSLSCLRFIKDNASSVKTTLGNHDLHLISTFLLNKQPNPKDLLADIFTAPDRNELIEYLQARPLALFLPEFNSLVCHAGLSPEWTLAQALKAAKIAEQAYQGKDARYYLANMYQNGPTRWQDAKTEIEKFCYTINAFTRMRYFTSDFKMDLSSKGSPAQDSPLIPWFELPRASSLNDLTVIFGHWAALEGKTNSNQFQAIDTGCVWGQALTALNLETQQRTQQKSL